MTTVNDREVLRAFHDVVRHIPFYADFLRAHRVDPEHVRTYDAFTRLVPLLSKSDVFGYPIESLSRGSVVPAYVSAIVSSGTSGTFSFGLLTKKDVAMQKRMLDTLLDELFRARANPPLIINALPMGVSFTSRYPVVPTSVRTDIARKVITTFGNDRQVIVITDPHVLCKMLEEGVGAGVAWSEYQLSAVVGGASASDSLITYMRSLMNGGVVAPHAPNLVLQTMGITEVALNIFGSTPDLIHLRHVIQSDGALQRQLFGMVGDATPEIMYHMAEHVHLEIVDQDENGVGDIVLTHTDTSIPTPLIRYRTGDKGRIIPHQMLSSIVLGLPVLPFTIVAVYGREDEYQSVGVTPREVEEALYRDHEYAPHITGHFTIEKKKTTQRILVHMKEGVKNLPLKEVSGFPCIGVPYRKFPRNIELNYEQKWKHTS